MQLEFEFDVVVGYLSHVRSTTRRSGCLPAPATPKWDGEKGGSQRFNPMLPKCLFPDLFINQSPCNPRFLYHYACHQHRQLPLYLSSAFEAFYENS